MVELGFMCARAFSLIREEVRRFLKYLEESRIKVIEPVVSGSRITYPLVERVTGLRGEEVYEFLQELEEMGVVEKKLNSTYLVCPECKGLVHAVRLTCVSCNSSQLKVGQVIEHLTCGHVDFLEKFLKGDRLVCPKCGKELKAIGVDYRRLGKAYRCLSCGNISPLTADVYLCQNCGREWSKENLKAGHLYHYTVNEEKLKTIDVFSTKFEELRGELAEKGLMVEYDKRVKGSSGVTHTFAIAIKKESKGEHEKPDMVIDMVSKEKGRRSENDILAFYVKSIDAGVKNKLIAAIPRLDEESRKLLKSVNVEIVEDEDIDTLLRKIKDKITRAMSEEEVISEKEVKSE